MSVKLRIELEKRIAKAFIDQTLAAGYLISVVNGADKGSDKMKDAEAIMQAMFATDDEYLFVFKPGTDRIGWVRFVYGNDGYDVISDYTVNLEGLMSEANKISDQYD